MSELTLTRMAHALAAQAAARQDHVARNVANADTPGYRATDLSDFADAMEATFAPRATRQTHLLGDAGPGRAEVIQRPGEPSPNGNTVSLETEMSNAAVIRQQHDMAMSVYDSSRSIMRAALGRIR